MPSAGKHAFLLLCLFCSSVLPEVSMATGRPYQRPLFRRMAFKSRGLAMSIEYDKRDPDSTASLDAMVDLAALVARSLDEQRRLMARDYPVPGGTINGLMTHSFSPVRELARALPVTEMLDIENEPERVVRLGPVEWSRRLVRSQLVKISLYKLVKSRTRALKRFLARHKFPNWLPLGLAAMESEPWTPMKMAVLLDAVRRGRLFPLTRYTYLQSFTCVERYRARQEAQAFCQWLTELLGKKKVISLMKLYADRPTGFWSSFRKHTGMSGTEAHRLFLADMLKYASLCVTDERHADMLFADKGLLGRPFPSPDGRLVAFTSNHLRPHSRFSDLFICRSDGSDLVFAAADVADSMAWQPSSVGLFFIRKVHSEAGKLFNQLCWAPARSDRIAFVRKGLDFAVLARNTAMSEVALSRDGRILSLLRQLPGRGRLTLYRVETSGRARPRLVETGTMDFHGYDHCWLDDGSIVFARCDHGLYHVMRLDPETGRETVLATSGDAIIDVSAGKNDVVYYSLAWAGDRGVAIRMLADGQTGSCPITVELLPGAGFRFNVDRCDGRLFYTGFGNGRFKLLSREPGPDRGPTVASLGFAPSVPAVTAPDETTVAGQRQVFGLRQEKPVWMKLRTKVVVESDTASLIGLWRDPMYQRTLETQAWYDNDIDRGNWELRYTNRSHHPGWFAGAFDTTKDDFLNLFPLSRFTNDALFRGLSFGWNYAMTPRESLSFAFEFKRNEYLPEFFDDLPVPADRTVDNHLYRIRYRWDLREESADKEVNPYGKRLVELSWADSPGFVDSGLRYREFILDWREYFKTGRADRDVLALRLLGGVRKERSGGVYPVNFTLGGPDTIRGIIDDSLRGTRFAALNVEYRMRLMDRRQAEDKFAILRNQALAPLFFFDTIYLAVFADTGTASYDSLSFKNLEHGFGLELRAQSFLTRWRPLVLRLGFAHGTGDLGENRFYLSTGTVF